MKDLPEKIRAWKGNEPVPEPHWTPLRGYGARIPGVEPMPEPGAIYVREDIVTDLLKSERTQVKALLKEVERLNKKLTEAHIERALRPGLYLSGNGHPLSCDCIDCQSR